MPRKLIVLALAWVALILGTGPALAETRVALVIGNGAYANTARLTNPRSDATAVAGALRKVGFRTTLAYDLDKVKFEAALKAFAREARGADMAMIYYAGHGMEMGGINYMIPVDASLATDSDVEFETVSLDLMLRSVEGATRLKVVILDACRNNPFVTTMKRVSGTRAVGRGLGRVEPAVDTFVAYAAKEGSLASDGDGTNSPFAASLVRQLPTPGLDIRLMFGKVRDEVLRDTQRRQEPVIYGSGGGEAIYLVAPSSVQIAQPGGAAPAPAPAFDPRQVELEFWQSVSAANNADHYQAYLRQYPSGAYAELARLRLASLTSTASAPRPSAPAPTPPSANPTISRASAVVGAMGVPCQVSDARLIGEDKKAATTYFEVACGAGNMGYVLQVPAGAAGTAFSCIEANTPPGPGQKPSAPCILAGNSNPMGAVAGAMRRAGVDCSPVAARGIGQTKTNTYVEVACSRGAGFIVVGSVPFDTGKSVQSQDCLMYDDAETNIKCTLSDKASRLLVVDRFASQAANGCRVTGRRFVGMSKDGASFYEASCEGGAGYIYKVAASGALADTYECAKATQILGGCTLTNARQAQGEQAGLYTRLVTAAGGRCDVDRYALFPSRSSSEEVVEMVCKGGKGAIGIFSADGRGQVLDCGRAPVAGYKCSLSADKGLGSLTADLRKFNHNSCEVSDSRVVGKTAKGTTYMEVACADRLKGYMIEYQSGPSVTAIQAVGCAFAGNCKLPGNI